MILETIIILRFSKKKKYFSKHSISFLDVYKDDKNSFIDRIREYNYIIIDYRREKNSWQLLVKKKKWRVAIGDRNTRYIYRHACRCTRQGRNLEQPQTDLTAWEIADCDWLLACRFLRPDSTENKCKTTRRGSALHSFFASLQYNFEFHFLL